jgi:ketosteroid isomerase-like protein
MNIKRMVALVGISVLSLEMVAGEPAFPPFGRTNGVSENARARAVAAIEARARAFERQFAAGDIERLVDDYFADDPWQPLMSGPGGVPPFRGRVALMEQFRAIRTGSVALRIQPAEIFVGRDLAQELGRVTITGLDGVARTGRYTVLWVSTQKGWKARVDFFAPDGWPDTE